MTSCVPCAPRTRRQSSAQYEKGAPYPVYMKRANPHWEPSSSFERLPTSVLPPATPLSKMTAAKSAISLSHSHLAVEAAEGKPAHHSSASKLQSLGQIFWRGIRRTGSSTKIDHRRSLFEGSSGLIQRRLSKKGTRLSQSQDSLAVDPSQLDGDCSTTYCSDDASTSDLGGPESEGVRTVHIFQITIGEAKGVPSKKRYYCELLLDGELAGRTSTKAKLDNECFWSESFNFDSLRNLQSVTVRLFKECLRNNERSAIGDVVIFPHDISGKKPVEKWYPLCTAKGKPDDSVSVRIKAHFMSLKILPQDCYASLLSYIERDPASLCLSLENVLSAKAKEELATTMVRLLYILAREKDFLSSLIEAEILKLSDPKLMFRGNSLGSKAMEAYMKLLGHDYLQYILRDYLQSLIRAGDDCEVDPMKIQNSVNLDKHQHTLNLYTEVIWQRILNSAGEFPGDMRAVFSALKQKLVLSDKGALVDNLISSCVFLRYLCPAILSPSLFALVSEYPNETANRTLTLVAKSIQTLANFARFGGKEAYMEFMNSFVEKQWTNMKQFLHVISTPLESSEPKKRIELDLDKEAARIAQRLFDAVKQLPEDDLTELRLILTAIKATENNPSMLLSPPDVLRSTKRLSDYDNVPTSQNHSHQRYPPRETDIPVGHYDLLDDMEQTSPPTTTSVFVTPPRRAKSASRRPLSGTQPLSIPGGFTDGDKYPPFPNPPPYSLHDRNTRTSAPVSSQKSGVSTPQNNYLSTSRLLSVDDTQIPIRRESMQRLRYIDDSNSSSCMSTPGSEEQSIKATLTSSSLTSYSSSPEQTPIPPFTPSASPFSLNSATPTPSNGQSYSNIPSYASSPFRSASYASISSQSMGSPNGSGNIASNLNGLGDNFQGKFNFSGRGAMDVAPASTAVMITDGSHDSSASCVAAPWPHSNSKRQHRGSVPSSTHLYNLSTAMNGGMTPSGSQPSLGGRAEPPRKFSYPYFDPLADNFYSTNPPSTIRGEYPAPFHNGLLVENGARLPTWGESSNGIPILKEQIFGSRRGGKETAGVNGQTAIGGEQGIVGSANVASPHPSLSGGLKGVTETVVSPLSNGHRIPPLAYPNSRGSIKGNQSLSNNPTGSTTKSPHRCHPIGGGGTTFPSYDPPFTIPAGDSSHLNSGPPQTPPRFVAYPPPVSPLRSVASSSGGTENNFTTSTPLPLVAMKPKLSRRLMARPKSAHLLTGVSSISTSSSGYNPFGGQGRGVGLEGELLGGPSSAASYENVYTPTSPVAWKMIEDRVEKKYTSEMCLLREKLDQYHTRLERSEKDGEVWKKRYEEIEPKLKEVKDIVYKIQALESEMKESHKKDDIITRQRAQIQSLESINAALLAFSIQFKNGLSIPPSPNASAHDGRENRDYSNSNNSTSSPRNLLDSTGSRSRDHQNGRIPIKSTALLSMTPAPALNIPPVPDVVNGLPSNASPSSYSSSGASPASALSSSEGSSPPFPHSMPPHSGHSSTMVPRPSPLLSNGRACQPPINSVHPAQFNHCQLEAAHDLVTRSGSAGTEQDSVASLNCTSSEHSMDDHDPDHDDSD